MLPKAAGDADVRRLDHYLTALEAHAGITLGATRVMVVATETGQAMFGLGSYNSTTPRLAALTWGAEDLAAAVGASSNEDADGTLRPLYQLARSLCLAAGAAAGVACIDTATMRIDDEAALRRACRAARIDGFTGKLAIHPGQVDIILETFRPSKAEVDHATRVIAAFENAVGVARLDGKMVDIPHLKQALRVLASAGGQSPPEEVR
jgi:citrate lyase subunit beta/citryl-CoA lyase